MSNGRSLLNLHEKFHEIVSANPGLLGDLVQALEARYGKQEIAALVNSYVEAYDGIYGRFDESMTADEQETLIMQYMNEVFADVYAGIRRGRANTAKAKQIMDSQTTEIQRAAQNRKAMQNKNAPPEQKFSYKGYARQRKYATIKVSPQEYAQIQSARMSKYTTYHQEMTDLDGIFAHDMFYLVRNYALDNFDVLKRLDPGKNQELIEIVMEELGNGNIGDTTDAHRFNEMLRRIKGKRNRNRNHDFGRSNGGTVDGMVSGAEGTSDRSGDLSGGDRDSAGDVGQNFSIEDDVAELDEGYARYMAEDDTPEGLAPDDDKIDDYNALAKAEKERRAKNATANQLKNRIKSGEKAIAAHREAKNALKNIGGWTKEAAEQLDQKIKLIRETMQIDRAALKEKQAAEEKHRQ